RSNKQEIMEYWKTVEQERRLVVKQVRVVNTQISALNMLNVATTDQSCQVIRLLEGQSDTQVPNDYFTEMEHHARSSDNKERTKRAKIHKYELQECVIENLDNSENDYKMMTTIAMMTMKPMTILEKIHPQYWSLNKMEDDKKWRLSTGKIVEDALYDFASKCSHEHFIIDPIDKLYVDNDVFTKEELREIGAYKRRSLPEIPNDLFDYLMTFAKDTLHELRHAINQPIKVIQGEFNPKKHHDYDWIRYVMHTIGESCNIASGLRKNVNRTIPGIDKMKRQKVGRKGDLLLRTSSDLEFGGEAGKIYKTDKGTKWLVESRLKLPKLLKDMFVQLASVLRNLKTVGFVHADCPEGYMCHLSRGDVYKVAEFITTHITETLPLIVTTWKAK
ncbi:23108_t:CDS:10, partial [Cetraspora pellucida]